MATREQVMTALLAVIAGTGNFQTVGRRNRSPESLGVAQCPALMLVEYSEEYERKTPNLPPVRRLLVKAIFYNDVGNDENAVPSTAINEALDALDVALQPDDRATNRFTLGHLVNYVVIDGTVDKAPGDVDGKSLAIVPLKIELP